MNIEEIQPSVEGLEQDLAVLKTRYESKVNLIDDSFQNLTQSLDNTDERVTALEEAATALEEAATALEEAATAPDVEETENRKKRITELEERVAALEAQSQEADPEDTTFQDEPERDDVDEDGNDAAGDSQERVEQNAGEIFAEFRAVVAHDMKEYTQETVNAAFYSEVCKKFNCFETVQLRNGTTGQSYPLRLPDAKYYVPSRDMLDRILRETKVDEVEWVKDKEDCEDIARLFVQRCNDIGINSVGRVMAWSGGHAFCVAIVQDGTSVDFVFLEPQTDEIITDMSDMYDITNALIIIS